MTYAKGKLSLYYLFMIMGQYFSNSLLFLNRTNLKDLLKFIKINNLISSICEN